MQRQINIMTWDESFLELYRRCVAIYQEGNNDFHSYYGDADLAFLASIGYKPRELFDFVEDFLDEGVPSESAALLIAAVRRDYFQVVQNGKPSDLEVGRDELPSFGEEIGGIAYLPRILTKARAKLAGELHPDVMFSCGGDRKFLLEQGEIHAADFLRRVWASDGDDQKIVDWLKGSTH